MDILSCFRKSKRNTSSTIARDSTRILPSIFHIFRKKKYSRLCQNGLDNTNINKSITLEVSSEENHSTEKEETQNREILPETSEVQKDPALCVKGIGSSSNTVQDKITKTSETNAVKNVRTFERKKDVQEVPKPMLFDTNNFKQLWAQKQPDINIIDFSNINPKSLTSRFVNNLEPYIEYQHQRHEKYLYDITSIQLTLENHRNSCRLLKLEDEYVTVEISSRLIAFDSSELSSNNSISLSENVKPCIPELNPIPTAGKNARKKRKKKNKMENAAACVAKTYPNVPFTGVSYAEACQDKSRTDGVHSKLSQSGQPTVNKFLSTKTDQPILKNTLPTISRRPIVKVPVSITGKSITDNLLSSPIRLEAIPSISQQGTFPTATSQNSIFPQSEVSQTTTKSEQLTSKVPGATGTVLRVVNEKRLHTISQPIKSTLPSITNAPTSKGAQPRGITLVGRIPSGTSQNGIFSQSHFGQMTTKSGELKSKIPGATRSAQLVIGQNKSNVGNLAKEQPVKTSPIPAPAVPSTSTNAHNSTSRPRFECTSLEKVHGAGFLINQSVMVPQRHWNCITGSKTNMFCEFCNYKFTKASMNGHINMPTHQKRLQECPVLGDYGQALIRKMESGRFHCAICNTTFTKTFTVDHVLSHTSMYAVAVQQAIAILNNNSSLKKMEKFTVIHDHENFTNKANKTALHLQTFERSNASSNVTNAVKKNENAVSQETADQSKFLEITSVHKVHGEGYIINNTVVISSRSYNAFSGSCAERFCNICQRKVEGANGFVHTFSKDHMDNLKKYGYTKDAGMNLFRKMPNDNMYCSICAKVISNADVHYFSREHGEEFIKSYMKADEILSNPSKYKIVSLQSVIAP